MSARDFPIITRPPISVDSRIITPREMVAMLGQNTLVGFTFFEKRILRKYAHEIMRVLRGLGYPHFPIKHDYEFKALRKLGSELCLWTCREHYSAHALVTPFSCHDWSKWVAQRAWLITRRYTCKDVCNIIARYVYMNARRDYRGKGSDCEHYGCFKCTVMGIYGQCAFANRRKSLDYF
jgi:hypothetical protein